MESLVDIFNSNEINTQTTLLRLALSFVAGAIIGFEREAHRQPAGLKTHILICIGSTLIMLLSIYIPQTFNLMQNGDPGRIAAQVVTGVGFIGAGAILRMGINVRGLTTAASIWAIAAVGLAIGAGMYVPAFISIGSILIVLVVVEQLEIYFFTPISIKLLTIKSPNQDSDRTTRSVLHNNHFRVIDMNSAYNKNVGYTFTYKIGAPSNENWVKLTNELIKADSDLTQIEFSDLQL